MPQMTRLEATSDKMRSRKWQFYLPSLTAAELASAILVLSFENGWENDCFILFLEKIIVIR
jgi:hypothetical protein